MTGFIEAAEQASWLGNFLCWLTRGKVVPTESYEYVVRDKNARIDHLQSMYKLWRGHSIENCQRAEAAEKRLREAEQAKDLLKHQHKNCQQVVSAEIDNSNRWSGLADRYRQKVDELQHMLRNREDRCEELQGIADHRESHIIEQNQHIERLCDSLDIVRQVLDESGVPCKHELYPTEHRGTIDDLTTIKFKHEDEDKQERAPVDPPEVPDRTPVG